MVLHVMSVVKKNIQWLMLSLLLFAVMVLYFVASNRYMLATENIAFFDQSAELEKVYASIKWSDPNNKIRVIYFWQMYCPCDATVMPHFKALYKEHTKDAIEFYLADLSSMTSSSAATALPSKHGQAFDNLLNKDITDLFRPIVSHTPAVAYGPHSLGYVCNAETSFVKKVITSLLQNIPSKNINVVGKGCFCKV